MAPEPEHARTTSVTKNMEASPNIQGQSRAESGEQSAKKKASKGKSKIGEPQVSSDVEIIEEEAPSPTTHSTSRRTRSSSRMQGTSQSETIARMESMAKRKIAYGMIITETAISDILVREFYANLNHYQYDGSVVISSIVDGVEFSLNEKLLGEILGVEPEGKRIYCSKRWDKKSTGVSFSQAMEAIADAPVDSKWLKKPNLDCANPTTKTMARIVKMAIMLKLGNLSGPSYNELNVIYHLKMGFPLNLPYLIISHMAESARNTKNQFVLPYGMILTRIFRHHSAIVTSLHSYTPMPRNNVIKKLIVVKTTSLKRKLEVNEKVSLDNPTAKKATVDEKVSLKSSGNWMEFLLKCTVEKLDHLTKVVEHLQTEVAELKQQQTEDKNDSVASENGADDDQEEEADYANSDEE
ncbi:hypothetical protein L6164_005774 [Bauhinia variegata]|uniref:Uncharacterized protein n=1 Tax=Bauhinia variegata TaxID=167791 RepID=A0ACB9PSU3_BAUVA|nr:hypothetical protein L6164_005774 [Bauhinia variegata]